MLPPPLFSRPPCVAQWPSPAFSCSSILRLITLQKYSFYIRALRRVETEVSAHHLEWSSHTFGGLGLNDHSDEDEEDIPPP
ncbi:hypothetical protein V6N13_114157 [Hibiscus sabdariffa]